MAVPEQTPYIEYTANGVVTGFALGFNCESKDHLIVTLDGVEPPVGNWSLTDGEVVFTTAPSNGVLVVIQRNTPFSRTTDYQSYNNSFRPQSVNGDFDRLWLKLQELGVADWLMRLYVDRLHQQQEEKINNLKDYVDDRDDELRSYLMEEIRKQGVALDQLDEYYNYLMQRLAQIAVDKGWEASFVVDGDKTQKQINENQRAINSRTVTPYDWGAFGDGIAHPLSERYATLAAAQAVFPSATSLTEYIDGLAIQNWLVEIGTVTHNLATCHGKFRVNTNISNAHVNNLNNRMKTKRVDFNAEIVFEGVTGNAFEIISPRQTVFTGWVHGSDIGGSNYQLRTVDNLFYIEDFLHANFSGLKGVAQYAKNLGLYAYSGAAGTTLGGYGANNNTSDLGSWLFVGCGHRFKHNTFNFIARLDTGGSGNSNQRSLLTLSAPHGLGDLRDCFIRFKGKPYLIESSTDTTLTVYPWLTEMDDSGTVEISKGGDFRLQGPDSNLIKISNGSTDCAICASQEGFYLGAKLQRTTENNDIGLRLGNGIDGVQIGGTYLGAYFEDNVFDIVKSSLAQDDAVIINPLALNLAKCHTLLPIVADTRVASEGLLNSYKVIYGNKVHQKSKYRFPSGKNGFSEFVLKIGDEPLKIRQNVGSKITLVDDYDVRRNFGTTDVSIEVLGSALNNGTTGNTTVKCESGYTINGLTSDFIIPISNSSFKISARLVDGLDWRVSIFYAEKPFGLKNHNWNPLAANTRQFTTVAVPEARMGSCAIASMDVSLKGTILSAEVTSFGVVTVTQSNPNADSVSDVSGNLFVKLV